MLLSNPMINPETKRRQALAKVYALLIRLAEDKEQPSETKSTDLQQNERSADHEKQND